MSNYEVRTHSEALATTYPGFQSTINMTHVTTAQFNHTHGLRKLGTCPRVWQADDPEGQCLLNLVFMAEVLVEAQKRSFQTLEWKVTVEVTEGKRNFLVWPEDRYQLGTCENRCKPSTS